MFSFWLRSEGFSLVPLPWVRHIWFVWSEWYSCVSHNKLQLVQNTGYFHTVVKYCCHSSHGSERCFRAVTEHSRAQKATVWDVQRVEQLFLWFKSRGSFLEGKHLRKQMMSSVHLTVVLLGLSFPHIFNFWPSVLPGAERRRLPPGPVLGGRSHGGVLLHGSAVVRGCHGHLHRSHRQSEDGNRNLGSGRAAKVPGCEVR